MINKISLQSKVTLIFVFTFVLLLFTFSTFDKMSHRKSHENVAFLHQQIVDYIISNRLNKDSVIDYLTKRNFIISQNPREILGNHRNHIIREKGFETVSLKDNYYLHIVTPHFRILFEDKINIYEKSYVPFIVFIFILILFIAIYLLIVKNIKDSELLLSSRQLFLRTVMHELKTPIAKGKIVSELIDDEKQKNRMSNIFDKLNYLINDFAKVEQIISKNYNTNFSNFSINTIIENSIEMLLLEKSENKVIQELTTNDTLKVDIDLIAMAIKNLLDNGIKYSKDHKVTIQYENKALLFISNGKKLPRVLEEYFKPFHNETKNKNHGMGLGLYIVKSILDIHGFTFEYNHKDEQNIFKIIFN